MSESLANEPHVHNEPWTDGTTSITLIGYSPMPKEQILERVVNGHAVTDLPGDFVLIATRPPGGPQLIATSVLGVRPYFYVDRPGPPVHGSDLFSVVTQAGLKWEWDLDAVRGMAWLGYSVGTRTLHPQVLRVPAASVLRHDGSGWQVTTDPFWDHVFSADATKLDDAIDVFHTVADEQLAEQPLISLSSGFDSRILLSRALACGQTPEVLTMGFEESTDVVVARRIAEDYALKYSVVALDPADYYRYGPLIAKLTGGTKTIGNWHTFLYCRGRNPNEAHLVGSNGEFARGAYVDMGSFARLAGLGGRMTIHAYWAARITRRARRMAPYLPFLTPSGLRDAAAFSRRSVAEVTSSRDNGLALMDRFYATQLVRNFVGNGLNLCGYSTRAMSPFLDVRFIRAAAALPRREKMGRNFHRRAIQRNAPGLLSYPANGRPLQPRAEVGYWLKPKIRKVAYSPMRDVYTDPRATEIIHDSPHLDHFLSPAERARAATAVTAEARGLTDAKEVLLTLHFAGEAADSSR